MNTLFSIFLEQLKYDYDEKMSRKLTFKTKHHLGIINLKFLGIFPSGDQQ
jgi:hypothetical protein